MDCFLISSCLSNYSADLRDNEIYWFQVTKDLHLIMSCVVLILSSVWPGSANANIVCILHKRLCLLWIGTESLSISIFVNGRIGYDIQSVRAYLHETTVVYDHLFWCTRSSHESLQDQLQHSRANSKQELRFYDMIAYAILTNCKRQSYRVDRPLSPVHNGCTTACDTTVVRLDTIVYHGAAIVAAVAQKSWSQSQEFGLVKLLRRDCNPLRLLATEYCNVHRVIHRFTTHWNS